MGAPRVDKDSTLWDSLSALTMACVLVAVLCVWDHYGLAWDEAFHVDYGDAVLGYFSTLGADTEALTHDDRRYGPGFDLLGALVRRLSPLDTYPTMRLLGAFVGIVGMVGTWQLARLLGGSLAGLVALVFVASTPGYFGQMFFNPKDIPFAAGYIWALYGVARVCMNPAAVSRTGWVVLSVLFAAAGCVRVAGLGTAAFLVGGLALLVAEQYRATGDAAAARTLAWALGKRVAGATLGGFTLIIAIWPWAQQTPFTHAAGSLGSTLRYVAWKGNTLYDGKLITTSALPWSYLPSYVVRQMPDAVVVLCALFLLRVAWLFVARFRERASLPVAQVCLVVAILLPPTMAIATRALLYDGMRHFLFIVPPMCAAAGLLAAEALERAAVWGRPAVAAAAGLLALLTAHPLRESMALHPYEYAYFNLWSGGYARNEGRWDTEYYGISYVPLHRALEDYLWRLEPKSYLNGTYNVTGCFRPHLAWTDQHTEGVLHHIDLDDIQNHFVRFYVSNTRHRCDLGFPNSPLVKRLRHEDRTLGLIRELGPEGKRAPRALPHIMETTRRGE